MALGNVGETVGGMFDDLKSRLGFNHEQEQYDDYDEYADFDEYAEYGENYSDDAPVGGYRPLTSRSPRSNRYASSDISSSLVSIDDVKASTPLPDRLKRDPLAPTAPSAPSSYSAPSVSSAPAATPASSAGVNSLFEPTGVTASAGAGSYDPYEAYSSANPTAHVPARALTVVKPTSYGDVERVAKAVKSGDVVVLAMRFTPDDLSKRILDFSFGVASALDANVECPGDKVFAIARGNALTDEEKRRLGAQGVL